MAFLFLDEFDHYYDKMPTSDPPRQIKKTGKPLIFTTPHLRFIGLTPATILVTEHGTQVLPYYAPEVL